MVTSGSVWSVEMTSTCGHKASKEQGSARDLGSEARGPGPGRGSHRARRTSFICGTGLNAWKPANLFLRASEHVSPMRLIDKLLVLLAKMASFGATSSSLRNSSCLVPRCSTIASMTRSADETASGAEVVVERLAKTESTKERCAAASSGDFLRAMRVSDLVMMLRLWGDVGVNSGVNESGEGLRLTRPTVARPGAA